MNVYGWIVFALFICATETRALSDESITECFLISREDQKKAFKERHEEALRVRDDALMRSRENGPTRAPALREPCFQQALFWIQKAIEAQKRIHELEGEALDRESIGCFQGFRFQSKYKRWLQSHVVLGKLFQERACLMQEEWRYLHRR